MKKRVAQFGIAEDKLIALGLFDYLIAPEILQRRAEPECGAHDRIVIAGNLTPIKSRYIYSLPSAPRFLLYGAQYDETKSGQENVSYMGSFLPDELPEVLQGDFGLVWDGDSTETCMGEYGAYLRYNNPHKTSLYLACGLPVIIWKEAALAPFILENHIGYAVESLGEISDLVMHVTDAEYQEMKKNVEKISEKLRDGFYLKRALRACLTNLGMDEKEM